MEVGKTLISESSVAAIHKLLDDATGPTTIPGINFLVVDRNNVPLISHSSGVRNIDTKEPMTPDTTLWLASCTKAITASAVMLLVQDGLIELDDSELLYKHVPELNDMSLVEKIDENGKAVLVKPKNKITFRMLLTHTAGFSYAMFDKRLLVWALEDMATRMDVFQENVVLASALVEEPGTKFTYGCSLEISSIFIKRFTGKSLGLFIRERICEPLGLKHIAFVPTEEMKKNISVVHNRDAHPGNITVTQVLAAASLADGLTEETDTLLHQGGAGMWARIAEYCKFLTIFLNKGAPIFTEDIYTQMVTDNMLKLNLPLDFAGVKVESAIPTLTEDIPAWFGPAPGQQGHGLSFLIQRDDVEGMRRKGSISWAGLCNLYWWADAESGIAGLFASQVQPFADPKTLELFYNVEREIYRGLKTNV